MKNAQIADPIRIAHILDAIQEIENYTQGIDKENFTNNFMMFNATLHQLEVIGEAANSLSESFLAKTPNVPWARIIGLRNIVIHEYFGVDDETIWNIIQINLPQLKVQIEPYSIKSN